MENFFQGVFKFLENTAKTPSLFKVAAWISRERRSAVLFQVWSVEYIAGYIAVTQWS